MGGSEKWIQTIRAHADDSCTAMRTIHRKRSTECIECCVYILFRIFVVVHLSADNSSSFFIASHSIVNSKWSQRRGKNEIIDSWIGFISSLIFFTRKKVQKLRNFIVVPNVFESILFPVVALTLSTVNIQAVISTHKNSTLNEMVKFCFFLYVF